MDMCSTLVDSAVACVMAQVSQKSTEELTNMVNNEESLENLISNLPQVKAILNEKQMLLVQNKSIAENNLAREPELKDAKERLRATHEKAVALREEFIKKKSEIENLRDQRSLGTVLALLQTATAQSEEESDKLAEQLLSGNMEVEEFIEKYKDVKQLAHMRKIKADKMTEVVSAVGDYATVRPARR